MIDVTYPDFSNTPANPRRPSYNYMPRCTLDPVVSIITPYYNTSAVFQETVRCLQRMSFTQWEWVIIDDGSTNAESLQQLELLQTLEPRVQVIHQENRGPAVARNQAAAAARGQYYFQLDSDDLVEPTFVEKALWFLQTHPQFAACNSRTVTFGSRNLLWPYGFQQYEDCIEENWVTNMAIIRREAFVTAGGYDERISYEHADWDFWLNLAQTGLWGFTLHEYLTWYRTQGNSLLLEIESNSKRTQEFYHWMRRKHQGLKRRFPHPCWKHVARPPSFSSREKLSFSNPLAKPASIVRILLLVPWLEFGGADKFNLDCIELLSQRGYEFTVAATRPSSHPWLSKFAAITPDIFCLHQFLDYKDYPCFLNYLIESRQIDAVLISNSELGYLLVPYLRACYPNLALLDYNHLEDESWADGGYPRMSVRLNRQLDANITCTCHLKEWMIARGADPERIQVCYCNINTSEWCRDRFDTVKARGKLDIKLETPVILFVGRIAEQKRPDVFGMIIKQLAEREDNFVALVIGTGPELGALQSYAKSKKLTKHLRLLGVLPNEEVRTLMAMADILILPSRYEGLALVLYEGMAMETVPVAADVGGHKELVTSDCGYLIPHGPHEIEEYVTALQELINRPQLRREMAMKARQRVVEHFDQILMVNGMEKAINHARELAEMRQPEPLDLQVLYDAMYAAIERLRVAEFTDNLEAERGSMPVAAFMARRLRRRILPAGSRRYEVYKRFRQIVVASLFGSR